MRSARAGRSRATRRAAPRSRAPRRQRARATAAARRRAGRASGPRAAPGSASARARAPAEGEAEDDVPDGVRDVERQRGRRDAPGTDRAFARPSTSTQTEKSMIAPNIEAGGAARERERHAAEPRPASRAEHRAEDPAAPQAAICHGVHGPWPKTRFEASAATAPTTKPGAPPSAKPAISTMSVVGLTLGNGANAIRPIAASAASVADEREHPRARLGALVPGEAGPSAAASSTNEATPQLTARPRRSSGRARARRPARASAPRRRRRARAPSRSRNASRR